MRGRGVATVTATGASSTVGRMAALLDAGPQLTPLQRRLRSLSRVLAIIVAILCVAVGIIGLIRGRATRTHGRYSISLAVAAVPESLPTVITLSLALGARGWRPACHCSSLAGGGGAGLGIGDRHRQDRNDHRRPHGGAAGLDSPGGGGDQGYRLWARWRLISDAGVVRAPDVADLLALLKSAVLCTDANVRFQIPNIPKDRCWAIRRRPP